MPEEKTEVADGLDKETLAWLEEEDKLADKTEKQIASGEIPRQNVAGWESDNWQTKASGAAPPEIDV